MRLIWAVCVSAMLAAEPPPEPGADLDVDLQAEAPPDLSHYDADTLRVLAQNLYVKLAALEKQVEALQRENETLAAEVAELRAAATASASDDAGGVPDDAPPELRGRPESLVILEDFTDGPGLFASGPHISGSTRGIHPQRSELVYLDDGFARGDPCQRVVIVQDSDRNTPGFLLRHLAGRGEPRQNAPLEARGWIGLLARTTSTDLRVALAIDDQANPASNEALGLERSVARDLIADGRWHLYQWNLEDPAQWENFAMGDGRIDGPTLTLDAILISSDLERDGDTHTVLIDKVAHRPDGDLSSLEPR